MSVEPVRWAAPPERRDRFIACDAEIWGPVLAQRPSLIRQSALPDRLGLSRVTLSPHREMVERGQAFPSDLREQFAAQVRALHASFGLEADVSRCLGTRPA